MTIGPGLRWAVESCRRGDGSVADRFAGGEPVPERAFESTVPAEARAALEGEQLLERVDGSVELRLRCLNINDLVAIMPRSQRIDADFVHLNVDTLWLIQLAWQHAAPGERAVELAAGNAIAAAHLVARYRRVIATDVPGPWLRYARLTLAANAARGRPSAVVVSDVAAALRPGAFDLVISNPPWSPAAPPDAAGNTITFMDGGPTGTELPARFLREGAELLRPGGTAITLCFDPTFDDGHQPLQDIIEDLRAAGLGVEIVDSPVFETDLVTTRLRARRLPTLRRGRHVAVIVRRPT